jgi:hypothetical protein
MVAVLEMPAAAEPGDGKNELRSGDSGATQHSREQEIEFGGPASDNILRKGTTR